MRKLKLQVQTTVNGFISGPSGEMDWMNLQWSDDIKQYVTQLTEQVDTILLGRKLAEGFIPYWTNSYHSEQPEEGSEIFVHTPKIVFTKTITTSVWDNTTLAKGELTAEINALKQKSGKDMIAYGGGEFVSSLIKARLIDEFHLFINPSAIQSGMTIFGKLNDKQDFELIHSKNFDCGIVVLAYKLK